MSLWEFRGFWGILQRSLTDKMPSEKYFQTAFYLLTFVRPRLFQFQTETFAVAIIYIIIHLLHQLLYRQLTFTIPPVFNTVKNLYLHISSTIPFARYVLNNRMPYKYPPISLHAVRHFLAGVPQCSGFAVKKQNGCTQHLHHHSAVGTAAIRYRKRPPCPPAAPRPQSMIDAHYHLY